MAHRVVGCIQEIESKRGHQKSSRNIMLWPETIEDGLEMKSSDYTWKV